MSSTAKMSSSASPPQCEIALEKKVGQILSGSLNEILSVGVLDSTELSLMHRYWQAANYLSVGQIYLLSNPLLEVPLEPVHCKIRLLGHFGTTPGLNFIYVHLNRAILARQIEVLYVAGPGHGGPALVANTYLEGTYSEIYPHISQDTQGMGRLFKQFSFPGGIPSHVSADCPGSIHEGGELGYALAHAYGACFDNPSLIVACVVGDGEAETGPCSASWHSNKFINPKRDGAVLPILHLNGFKISNPTVLARISDAELQALMVGYGHNPFFVTDRGDPLETHRLFAATLDKCLDLIASIKQAAEAHGVAEESRPLWPMIVFRSPKGWTGPKTVDGLKSEGSWRSHQVPFGNVRDNPVHLALLEQWMKSYSPENLFSQDGKLLPELQALAPKGKKRMGDSPYYNPGVINALKLPDFKQYAFKFDAPGALTAESPQAIGLYLRDVLKLNEDASNFRIFGPDETASNRLGHVLESTNRTWMARREADDDCHLASDGRVMEVLSEHMCQGWIEGYLLTGRHGFYSSYEAFIPIVASMFAQHAKWLKVISSKIGHLPWRKQIASLNYFITSHVWRQDHNGFSHQDPGFIDVCMNKKPEIVSVFLPPDGNTLLAVTDHCLQTVGKVNIIVCGKQAEFQWLDIDAAIIHCQQGLGIWRWASNDMDAEPDVVLATAGDTPTLEGLATVDFFRQNCPELKIRFVNIVDLMTLTSPPFGISDDQFDSIFTKTKPVVFAYHAYPALIHRLVYRRANYENFHVRGFHEEGTTTTPFDMLVLNELDRFHLAMAVINRVPHLQVKHSHLHQVLLDKLCLHFDYIRREGVDMPEIEDWKWNY